MRRAMLTFLCLLGLVACGSAPLATPSPTLSPLTATIAATATAAPTATALPPTTTPTLPRVPTPTTAPARTGHVSDASGWCWVTLPGGFAEDTPGSGYFPATDGTGFVGLDNPTARDPVSDATTAAGTMSATLAGLLDGYTAADPTLDDAGAAVTFTASASGQPGHGSIIARPFAQQICVLSFFALDRSSLDFSTQLLALRETFSPLTLSAPTPTTAVPMPTATPSPNWANAWTDSPTPTSAPAVVYPTVTTAPVYPTATPTAVPYVPYAPSSGGSGSGSGCGSRGGPGGPRTSSGKCPAWPKK